MNDESPMAVIARHQTRWPVMVGAIAKDLGIKVKRMSLGSAVAGQLMRDHVRGGKSGFVVFLNSDQSEKRQKFTLAHEIAHFVLHRDLIDHGVVDDTMYRSELSGHLESEANRLAADIVMPVRLVRRALQTERDPKKLASMFGVSEHAMKIRLGAMTTAAPAA
jgi:predicted transcriptional regulator